MDRRSRSRVSSFLVVGASALGLCLPLPSQGAAAAQGFGGSVVATAGDVLVGEPANATLPGVVYVYGRGPGGWEETARLSASPIDAPPDGFGRSLAGDGAWAIVGASAWEGGRGAAVLYRRTDEAGWTEVAWLAPEGLEEGDAFGSGVVLLGDVAVVSAPGAAGGAGALHVFAREGADWVRRSTYEHAVDGEAPGLGAALALDGSALLVGSTGGRGVERRVYAFELDAGSGSLAFAATLAVPDALPERSDFGAAVAVRGAMALVGAPGVEGGVGAVMVFERDGDSGRWIPTGALSPFAAEPRARFGSALAFGDDEAWVGAPGGSGGEGVVFRFARAEDGGWLRATRAARPGLGDRAAYGSAFALDRSVAVVGAAGVDGRAGAAVIHGFAAGSLDAGAVVAGDHRGLPAIVGLDEEIACVDHEAARYECDKVNLISFLPIKEMGGGRGARLNDLWGWTDPESGREIAIVGRSDGTSFVDLTDPYNPRTLGDLPKTPGSRSSVWRDMKVHRDHAYIVADGAGAHGVQVFDLRRLRDVGGEPVEFEPDHLYEGVHSAHNIVVNEETGFAYVVGSSGGGETCGGGLHMLDLSDPGRPEFAGCFADAATGRRLTGYSHDAQCVVYRGPDTEHRGREICLGSNETALSIADVTDKENPVALAVEDYPAVAYAHQGWLTEDHRYFYMNDEGDEPQGLVEGTRTLVWDVMDLDEPVLVAEYIAETPDTDHNLYIRGDLMYQSNYGAGLRILDISDPVDPVEIAYFDNSPYGGASWSNYPYFESGVVVLTSTGDGLFVVRNTARRELIP